MTVVVYFCYDVIIHGCRSMHGNPRLGEIVEAVKDLEQAIVEDTGIPSKA